MSIVLTDGTVLPDIPADVLESYSHFVIIRLPEDSGNSADYYYFMYAAGSETVYLPPGITGASNGYLACEATGFSRLAVSSEADAWTLQGADASAPVFELTTGYVVVWSNHDIKAASAFDGTTPTIGTEIYFKSCIFRLPDGTELPALPEGCFEKYPYGVIGKLENTDGTVVEYEFDVSISQVFYVPNEVSGFGVNTLRTEEYGCRNWKFVPGGNDWVELNDTPDEGVFLPEGSFGNAGVYTYVWSNHDILTATAMNDDYTFEIGSDLYRKSDVNYRIYGGWLNSMGNQARRLGNVSGELKPGEMETVFKGVTAGGGDIVEPETYPDSEDVDFGYTGDDNPYTGKYFYGTWDFATNLPENPSSEYPYAVIAKQSGSSSVSLFLCAEEPYYYASNKRIIWGVTKPAKSYYYSTTDNEWKVGNTAITGGNAVNPFYWSNVDILNNTTGAIQYAASEPVPEMKEGVTVGGIDNSATYKISGSELTALGLVTKQITGVTASTPSAMISALQMYAGTH